MFSFAITLAYVVIMVLPEMPDRYYARRAVVGDKHASSYNEHAIFIVCNDQQHA